MLQCTLTFQNNNDDTVTRRISDEPLTLSTHYWDPYIASLATIKNELTKPYGGRVKISTGGFNLLPTTFDGQGVETGYTWPPPKVIEVLIEYGEGDTPGDKVILFEGTAHYDTMNRADISYKLYSLLPSYKVRSLKINQTLSSIFSDFVTLWDPDYTLDTTYAESPSPVVDITSPDSEILFIDILADICEYYGHFFYIDHVNATVHLVSMDISNGPTETITEFDFQPSSYIYPSPIRSISVGDSKVPGDYVYGEEINFSNSLIPEAFIRTGDNSGDDEVWFVHNGSTDADGNPLFIPYDGDKLYRYTLTYRKKAGTHEIYGGFHCMLDLDTSNNINGADSHTAQHWIFSRSGAAEDKWYTVTGYMTGFATPGTTSTGEDGTTISGTVPAINARTGTTYIRPLVIENHTNQPGETDISYLAVHEIEWDPVNSESDGSVVNTLFEYKAEYFNPDEWEFFVGDASLIESSAQDAIDSVLTVAGKPTVNLRMPLEPGNIYKIGQELTWIDESQHKSIEATIKVRGIDFDFGNVEVVIVGEGTLVEAL